MFCFGYCVVFFPNRRYDCVTAAEGPEPPEAFDWRDTLPGSVTPVRDQGKCGGCWAFATAETLEAAWIRAGRSPDEAGGWPLSVQEFLAGDTSVMPGSCGM